MNMDVECWKLEALNFFVVNRSSDFNACGPGGKLKLKL